MASNDNNEGKRPSLYAPLPTALGGTNARPTAAAVSALMPALPGSKLGPDDFTLNKAIRNKALQLDGTGNRPVVSRTSGNNAVFGSATAGSSSIAMDIDGSDNRKNKRINHGAAITPTTRTRPARRRRRRVSSSPSSTTASAAPPATGPDRNGDNGSKTDANDSVGAAPGAGVVTAAAAENKSSRFRLPEKEAKHAIYAPLRALWRDYSRRALADSTPETIGDRVLRLDLHGAVIRVVRATDPTLVGVVGTVVAETANTVVVVTEQDRALTLLKRAIVIAVTLGTGQTAEYSMGGLCMRASERSAKKIKKRQAGWI